MWCKRDQVFTQLLKLDKGNPIKEMRQNIIPVQASLIETYLVLYICDDEQTLYSSITTLYPLLKHGGGRVMIWA